MNKLYSVKGEDIIKMTLDLLNAMEPLTNLPKNSKIGIKPNLVCANPASDGATTHPEIVEGIIIYLLSNGYKNLLILEGAWIGDSTKRAFKICGYEAIAKKYDIKLFDTKGDKSYCVSLHNKEYNICKTVNDLDYLINVPLIKGHCQTKITCALKNMKGLIPDKEKRRFHTLGLHKPIAHLNEIIKQDLIIVDGICPDPYFEEGGSPHRMDMIVGAYDPVLMDSYAAGILGYKPYDIKYIRLAEELGIGNIINEDTQMIDISHNAHVLDTKIEQKDEKYLNLIEDAGACSACYSNLVSALRQLEEQGLTDSFAGQISIGQHYRGYAGELGVGDCTCMFAKHLKGCPPTTEEMIEFLKESI